MIHVCFAIYDKAGHYSKFLGTTICSLFENTNAKVMVHILHDNTLTEDNHDKLVQLVARYNQIAKFYNVEKLCTEEIEKIKSFFPNIGVDRHSIATFYRFFILNILPQEIEKVLYLDADIIVNLDITEFWQIKLGDKPFGAVPEFYQISDKDASIESRKKSITICRENVVSSEDYFNAGVMLINLKVLRNEKATISAGMKFISEHPQFSLLDQDILNYCFSTSYLKLPVKFNRFVIFARLENEWSLQRNVYHFAASRMCFTMDMNDPYNQLFMNYFVKTPWVDVDMKIALSGDIIPRKDYAISVIIPMYNAEETIGECLDGLLIQTFQDFEVIVVDDCSTDDSVKIVEAYAPKFNGRLKLEKTEKNSGTGGHVARNIGLMLSRGDYVYFIDADDMILGNAFETLYKAAILYNADVVYTSSYYSLSAPNDASLILDGVSKKNPKVKTEFIIDDPNKSLSRIFPEGSREIVVDSWTKLGGPGNDLAAWTKLISRDFLLKNKIFFANIVTSGDAIFALNLYCHARRLLRISTPLYLHRSYNVNSITRTVRSPQEKYSFWFSCLVDFTKALHKLEKENEILTENPIYCLEMLRMHFVRFLKLTEDVQNEFDSREIYKFLHSAFIKSSDDPSALLLPFFAGFVSNEKKVNDYLGKLVNKFRNYFTARIDVKFTTTKGDFQIVSISDVQAIVRKPIWLQRGGIGYMIQSYSGAMEFVTKSTADGQIKLDFKTVNMRSSEEQSKHIPYWIDYTKLTVNGKVIFDTITPAWHDKPYNYALNVKADEEIKIEVEWLPHIDDRPNLSVQEKNAEMLRKSEALVAELRTALDNEKKVHGGDIELIRKFSDYFTARLDFKHVSKKKGDVQIVSISDAAAKVKKPRRLQKDGVYYQIQSCIGKLDFVAKVATDGEVDLLLRGIDVRDPEGQTKRIPYWVDYTKLTVNGKVIFDTITPAWHDKPYNYALNVKAGEEVQVEVEWLPHSDKQSEEQDVQVAKKLEEQSALVSELQAALDTEKKSSEEQNALVSELRTALDAEKKVHGEDVELIRKFSDYFTARLDFKIALNGEGDFQIVSVSDEKAVVKKVSRWLSANEVGYSVQSYVGKMELVAKVVGGGQFNLNLKGMDIRDPQNKRKRIPYWIDYTKLTVNGEVVFDSITPVWHDKPYSYALNVNADEEIKIEVEWLPHSDKQSEEQDVQVAKKLEEQNALVTELQAALDNEKKSADEQNALVSELRAALDNEKKVHGGDVELIRKFSDYFTARLDFKIALNGEGDFQIVSVSDEKATVKKVSRWLSANEVGYSVQSYVGKMELVAKVVGGGQFNLNLKGMDIRDPQNKRKRIPYWIDYTKLTINGEIVFDELTPVWHDKPYSYALDVNVDEEIKIEVEWLPHSDKQSEEQDVQVAKKLEEQSALISELQAALDSEKKSSDEQNALVAELRTELDNEKKATDEQNALVSELRAALDNEKKVHGDDVELIRKFSNYFTARLDFKLMPSGEGDFKILSVSDEKAVVKKARGLSANEVGYSVQSYVGKMEIVGKVTGGGQFNLNLKGKDVRDPQNKKKRIPYWIDYTNLTVNGEVILDKVTPVWHNEPYNYIFYAKADEEIRVEVEWVPHKGDN